MSESDFLIITHNGALCDASGEIGVAEFEDIIRSQLTLYIQVPRETCRLSACRWP